MTNNPVYYDVGLYLDQNGFGSFGSDIFGGEWGDPDKQVLLREGVGNVADLKELYENPGLQIICRGEKRGRDIDVYTRAKEISDFLLTLPDSVEIQGVCYTGFEPTTNIAPLGKDENERFLYSMNFSTFRNVTN